MSYWTPLGPPPSQGNPPPRPNPTNQGHPQAPPFNGLGFGFQAAAAPFSFAPPNPNPAPQQPINPFANTNNHGGFAGPAAQAAQQASQVQGQQSSTGGNNGNDNDDDDDDEDSDDEDPDNVDPDLEYDEVSPISLVLRVPLNVKGNNNIVAIDAGKLAKQVADAMVASLRDLSCGGNGIPMIDHNGQPRPVSIRVDLKVNVTGDKNTVGEKAVLALVPVAVRKAMLEGVLPATPLSPLEDKVFTGVIDQLRTTGVEAKAAEPKLPEQRKREREDSYDDEEEGTDESELQSSPKRSRMQ
jgi:hypothetical protein